MDVAQAKKFNQISTGRSFNSPSENPIKMNESMLLQRTQNEISQFESNVGDAKSLLAKMDVTYESTIETIHMAKEEGIKGSSGTFNQKDRDVMAENIEQHIDQILSFANEKHLDRYIFSGQKTDTPAIEYDGNNFTYNGNENRMSIDISNHLTVDVSDVASKTFQPVLESLVELRDSLRSGNNGDIQQALGSLDDSFVNFVDNRSKMGVQLNSLETIEFAYKEINTDLEVKRSEVESIDMA